MRLAAECPRCGAWLGDEVSLPEGAAGRRCPVHGETLALWRAVEPSYDALAEHLVLARPMPTWVPWPLPGGFSLTDFGVVAPPEGRTVGAGPRAVFATCGGRTERDGAVSVTVLAEEAGVGLGARCAGVAHTDPGVEAGVGPAQVRVELDGMSAPLWTISTADHGAGEAPLDRAVLAGEARGRWLWLVFRPAAAVLLATELPPLEDLSTLGPELVDLPFAVAPKAW